jgi:hypothetical protein
MLWGTQIAELLKQPGPIIEKQGLTYALSIYIFYSLQLKCSLYVQPLIV